MKRHLTFVAALGVCLYALNITVHGQQVRVEGEAAIGGNAGKSTVIDIRQEVHDRYVREVDREHEQMIWTHPGMTTYYRNSRGRVFSAMPWRFVDYWRMTHDPDLSLYRQTPA